MPIAAQAHLNTKRRVARKQSGPFHLGQTEWARAAYETRVRIVAPTTKMDTCYYHVMMVIRADQGENIFVWIGDDDGVADVDQPLFTSSIGTFSLTTD